MAVAVGAPVARLHDNIIRFTAVVYVVVALGIIHPVPPFFEYKAEASSYLNPPTPVEKVSTIPRNSWML
jgi:hypothetical protein